VRSNSFSPELRLVKAGHRRIFDPSAFSKSTDAIPLRSGQFATLAGDQQMNDRGISC
jgi:hypothetical protein